MGSERGPVRVAPVRCQPRAKRPVLMASARMRHASGLRRGPRRAARVRRHLWRRRRYLAQIRLIARVVPDGDRAGRCWLSFDGQLGQDRGSSSGHRGRRSRPGHLRRGSAGSTGGSGSLQDGSASGHRAARARHQTSLQLAAGTGCASGTATRHGGVTVGVQPGCVRDPAHALEAFGIGCDAVAVEDRCIDLGKASVGSPPVSVARSSVTCTSGRKACASSTVSIATPSSYMTKPLLSWAACCGPKAPSMTCATFASIDPEKATRMANSPGVRSAVASPTLHRRAEVGRKATERYLDALASIDEDTTLDAVLHRLGQPQYWHGRRVRALHPFAPDDRQLLQAVSRGEFTLNGFRKSRSATSPFLPSHPRLPQRRAAAQPGSVANSACYALTR